MACKSDGADDYECLGIRNPNGTSTPKGTKHITLKISDLAEWQNTRDAPSPLDDAHLLLDLPGSMYCPQKAEVTGSNPVECVKYISKNQ